MRWHALGGCNGMTIFLCVTCGEGMAMIAAGPRDNIVIHPGDAPDLQPLPDWENSAGCCGPSGGSGLNRACPCGARVARLAADCWGPYEFHLDAKRVHVFDPS